MVQDTLLCEVDLGYVAEGGCKEVVAVPAPVLIKAALATAEALGGAAASECPPPYSPAAKRRSLLKAEVESAALPGLQRKASVQSTGLPMYSVYPMYQSGETAIFASSPSTYTCQYCTREQGYWETVSSGANWSPLLLQLALLPWALFALAGSLLALAAGALLFVLVPVGPAVAWCSSVAVRQLAIVDLALTSRFRKPAEVCLHCNPYGPPELDVPSAVFVRRSTGSPPGFLARMTDPLRDAFTWRALAYFLLVLPVVATVGCVAALAALAAGLLLPPLLPRALRATHSIGQLHRSIARKSLAVF